MGIVLYISWICIRICDRGVSHREHVEGEQLFRLLWKTNWYHRHLHTFQFIALRGKEGLKTRDFLLRRTKAIMMLFFLCCLASTVSYLSFFFSLFSEWPKYGSTWGDGENYNPVLLKSQTFAFCQMENFKESHSTIRPCCMTSGTRFVCVME